VANPAHEGHRGDERPVAARADDLLGAEAVLDRHHRRLGQAAAERRGGGVEVGRLRRDDDEIGAGELGRVARRPKLRGEVALAGDPQAVALERGRVFGTPGQHGDVGDPREVRRVQAPDHAAADDAHALRHCGRA
jgi:hypothetical protein